MKDVEKTRPIILVLHGPNLNLLGHREPEIYGSDTLDDINQELNKVANGLGFDLKCFQSNHEGELVDEIQCASFVELQKGSSKQSFSGILINPAAFTHTSVALRDVIAASSLPTVEIHLSNVHAREKFRQHSFLASQCIGQISGFGKNSYILGLQALASFIEKSDES